MAIEAGKYDLSLLLAFRIARAFGKNLKDVFIFECEQLAS
jgi:DNA-binding XRE family transcriptional regulator